MFGSGMRDGLIEELRRQGEPDAAERMEAYAYTERAASHKQIMQEAEATIKAKFMDWEHCAQSSRAVKMFLEGVEWTLNG